MVDAEGVAESPHGTPRLSADGEGNKAAAASSGGERGSSRLSGPAVIPGGGGLRPPRQRAHEQRWAQQVQGQLLVGQLQSAVVQQCSARVGVLCAPPHAHVLALPSFTRGRATRRRHTTAAGGGVGNVEPQCKGAGGRHGRGEGWEVSDQALGAGGAVPAAGGVPVRKTTTECRWSSSPS